MRRVLLTRPLIVATASPNRRAILEDAGLQFETAVPETDESVRESETPEQYVKRLAEAKARSIESVDAEALILSADTCIDIEGEILGKPRDEPHAKAMLTRLSGQWHEVWGGIVLRDDKAGTVDVRGLCTKVKFLQLTNDMIDWYVSTGEPMNRAGAYAIQGKGRSLVESVDGCVTNVIGLSVPAVFEMLSKLQ